LAASEPKTSRLKTGRWVSVCFILLYLQLISYLLQVGYLLYFGRFGEMGYIGHELDVSYDKPEIPDEAFDVHGVGIDTRADDGGCLFHMV